VLAARLVASGGAHSGHPPEFGDDDGAGVAEVAPGDGGEGADAGEDGAAEEGFGNLRRQADQC
jgi:hypothetical protein